MNIYIKNNLVFLFLITVLLSVNSFAINIEQDKKVHISNLHVLEDDLIALGDNITIDGTIKGDFIGCGTKIFTNGKIKNSVNLVVVDYTHSGEINGSLRVVSNSATILGTVNRSLVAMSFNDFHLGEKGLIGKDAVIRSNIIYIDGKIDGNTKLYGDEVYITGLVEKDLYVEAKVIQIIAPAIIKGDFTYISDNQADIDISSGVTIVGDTKWNLPENLSVDENNFSLTYIIQDLAELLAAFLFGIILFTFTKRYMTETMFQMKNRFGVSVGIGVLSFIIIILSIVILVISLATILAGTILISSDYAIMGATMVAVSTLMIPISSFVTVSGGVLLYSGKVIISLLIGYYVIGFMKKDNRLISKSSLLLGLFILYIIFNLPVIGIYAALLASIVGLGGIILGIKNCHKNSGQLPPIDQSP